MRPRRGSRPLGPVLAILGALFSPALTHAATPEPPRPAMSTFEPGVREALETALRQFDTRAATADSDAGLGVAWGELAMAYQAHHLQGLARSCYEQAVRLAPDSFKWRYFLGFVYQETGEYRQASTAYTEALALDDGYLPARLRRGQVLLALQEAEPAIADFESVLAARPGQAAALAGLGQAALRQRRYREAIDYLEAALAAEPAADRLHHPLAMAYRHERDVAAARRHLALQGKTPPTIADPLLAEMAALSRSAQYYLERGYAAARAGRLELAVDEFRRAVAYHPDDPTARVSLGQGLLRLGQADAALQEFDRALAIDPQHPAARYRRGGVREARGDDVGAAEDYSVAVANDPDYLQAWLRLAETLMRLDRYEEAAAAYSAADAPSEQRPFFAYSEAVARLAAGDCQGAVPMLERARDEMPGSGEILQALARSYSVCPGIDAERVTEAERLARQLYEARADYDHAETLAMAAAANGHWPSAIGLQTQLLRVAVDAGDSTLQDRARVLLERYRSRRPADAAWPPGHPALRPGAGRESPADR